MKKLLIFGSGFIVKHIIDEARNNGVKIDLIYNQHEQIGFNKVNQYKLSDLNLEEFLEASKPNYILLAFGKSVVYENNNMVESFHENVLTIYNVLEKINMLKKSLNDLQKIIIIGSAAEYGNKYTSAIKEKFTLHPSSIYGLTKAYLYQTFLYAKTKNLPVIYTRQFNAIGPGQRDSFVLGSFCKQIALIEKKVQEPILKVGNLSSERDFIDVRDAARAYLLLFLKGHIGHVYNIGSGISISIEKLLNKVVSFSRVEVEIESLYPLLSPVEYISKEKVLADISKIERIGFKRIFELEDTITDTLNYWRNYV